MSCSKTFVKVFPVQLDLVNPTTVVAMESMSDHQYVGLSNLGQVGEEGGWRGW